MKKYLIFISVTSLIIFTSIIKTSTRELETKIFNSEEKIKILGEKNNYLSSPQRLFELKNEYFGTELKFLKIYQIKYLNYNEKK